MFQKSTSFCSRLRIETAYKNQHCHSDRNEESPPQRCHSERSEESLIFLFKSKKQKRRSFGFQPQDVLC